MIYKFRLTYFSTKESIIVLTSKVWMLYILHDYSTLTYKQK